MYTVQEITNLIATALKYGKGRFKLPSGKRVRLTKTLKTFYHRGVTCTNCGLTGTVFREVKHSKKTHLQLLASKNDTEVLMTCDHIIPQSKGGSNNFSNLQTLCCQCNYDKKDKIDSTLVEGARYSYKSIKNHIFNAHPKNPLRSKFSREFGHIQGQATKLSKAVEQTGLLCGEIDEILQLLYYIHTKYGYNVRLKHLRRIPSQKVVKSIHDR